MKILVHKKRKREISGKNKKNFYNHVCLIQILSFEYLFTNEHMYNTDLGRWESDRIIKTFSTNLPIKAFDSTFMLMCLKYWWCFNYS